MNNYIPQFDTNGYFALHTRPLLGEFEITPSSFSDTPMPTLDNRILRSYHCRREFSRTTTIYTEDEMSEYCASHMLHRVIYTDGSLDQGNMGAAAILYQIQIDSTGQHALKPIDHQLASGTGHSSFAAELLAITLVSILLTRRSEVSGRIGIFTDSLSALGKCHAGPQTEIDRRWAESLCSIPTLCSGLWTHVKAHAGILGNETADGYASEARTSRINWEDEPIGITWETFQQKLKDKWRKNSFRIWNDYRSHHIQLHTTEMSRMVFLKMITSL